MRAISWNCADHFPRKAPALEALAPDFAIVCEVRAPHAGALGAAFREIWNGAEGQRGMLMAVRRSWDIKRVVHAERRHLSLVEISKGRDHLSLIGVWAMKGTDGYEGSVIAGLNQLLPEVASPNVLVAGDFNSSAHFDPQHPPARHFARIEACLAQGGCRSLWHDRSGEVFGAEKTATHFHHWKQSRPFHIDFMFASSPLASRLSEITIGGFEEWCPHYSDHVPICAEFS